MHTYTFIYLALYWVFSAVVGGMPEPTSASAFAYRWTYKSLHLLAGNIGTAFHYTDTASVHIT